MSDLASQGLGSSVVGRPESNIRTPFFCARCDRYFLNLQGFSRHQNLHVRNDMLAARRRQALRSCMQGPTRPVRLRRASIPQHRVQRQIGYGRQSIQTMIGSTSRGGPIITPNRSIVSGVSHQRIVFFSSFISTNGVNFSFGACGTGIARDLIPCNPNPVMPQSVPTSSYHVNANMMSTPSVGGLTIGGLTDEGTRRGAVTDGSNDVNSGEGNEELDLDFHL